MLNKTHVLSARQRYAIQMAFRWRADSSQRLNAGWVCDNYHCILTIPTRTAQPELDPPETLVTSCGFRIGPVQDVQLLPLIHIYSVVVLPTIVAPIKGEKEKKNSVNFPMLIVHLSKKKMRSKR